MKQYYFEEKDSERCHQKSYFEDIMRERGINELTVFKAVNDKINGVFWCKYYEEFGESGACSKLCGKYQPKNKIKGCCIHYTRNNYELGEQIILKLKK